MRVSEIFGPTIQGEGPSAGQRAIFVRLYGCNLDCRWCDTSFTWDTDGKNGTVFPVAENMVNMTPSDVVASVVELRGEVPARVVISGGEPLAQRASLEDLIVALVNAGFVNMEVETNGTLAPFGNYLDNCIEWNVSPKLSSSGVTRTKAWKPEAVKRFNDLHGARFKFVVTDPIDVDEVDEFCVEHAIAPSRVWLMPEGTDVVDVVGRWPGVVDAAVERGYNATQRLHVLAWGNERRR